jgi:hypothetical protein
MHWVVYERSFRSFGEVIQGPSYSISLEFPSWLESCHIECSLLIGMAPVATQDSPMLSRRLVQYLRTCSDFACISVMVWRLDAMDTRYCMMGIGNGVCE